MPNLGIRLKTPEIHQYEEEEEEEGGGGGGGGGGATFSTPVIQSNNNNNDLMQPLNLPQGLELKKLMRDLEIKPMNERPNYFANVRPMHDAQEQIFNLDMQNFSFQGGNAVANFNNIFQKHESNSNDSNSIFFSDIPDSSVFSGILNGVVPFPFITSSCGEVNSNNNLGSSSNNNDDNDDDDDNDAEEDSKNNNNKNNNINGGGSNSSSNNLYWTKDDHDNHKPNNNDSFNKKMGGGSSSKNNNNNNNSCSQYFLNTVGSDIINNFPQLNYKNKGVANSTSYTVTHTKNNNVIVPTTAPKRVGRKSLSKKQSNLKNQTSPILNNANFNPYPHQHVKIKEGTVTLDGNLDIQELTFEIQAGLFFFFFLFFPFCFPRRAFYLNPLLFLRKP